MMERLPSERVIVQAPMSFTGSARRIWRLARRGVRPIRRSLWAALALVMILGAWTIVLAWYVLFGVLLVPYRLSRRQIREARVRELRHRETLDRIENAKRPD